MPRFNADRRTNLERSSLTEFLLEAEHDPDLTDLFKSEFRARKNNDLNMIYHKHLTPRGQECFKNVMGFNLALKDEFCLIYCTNAIERKGFLSARDKNDSGGAISTYNLNKTINCMLSKTQRSLLMGGLRKMVTRHSIKLSSQLQLPDWITDELGICDSNSDKIINSLLNELSGIEHKPITVQLTAQTLKRLQVICRSSNMSPSEVLLWSHKKKTVI